MIWIRGSIVWASALAAATPVFAQQELATLSGNAPGAWFGWAVAFVGDVDNDGHEDFAASSPRAVTAAGMSGSVTVFSGRTTAALHTWSGAAVNDYYGTALAGAGDVDGDGHADVIVGAGRGVAFLFPDIGGYVQVRSGQSGAVLLGIASPIATLRGFGCAVAGGHDVDGDAVPDVLVGAPGGAGASGAAFVFSGATGALLRSHFAPEPHKTLGYAVAFVGDVGGDGRSEYALGAPAVLSPVYSYVQLFDGASGDSLWRTLIDNDFEELGWSLAPLGDVNGDGAPEVLAGARQNGSFSGLGRGRVRVLDGASGAVLAEHSQGAMAESGVALGWSVTSVGDLDGDGRPDYAAGAPGADPHPSGFAPARATRVWRYGTQPALIQIPQGDSGDAFGFSIASGDANGDGLRDLLIGEPYDDDNGDDVGSVHLYTFVRAPTYYCVAQANSQGCVARIAGTGTPSASSPASFVIGASDVLNQTTGILFYGSAPLASPHLGGTLCVRQPVRRTALQATGGNFGMSDCSGTLAFDFNAWVQSGFDPALGAGDELFAQYWSRDALAPSTTNLSDALAFYVEP